MKYERIKILCRKKGITVKKMCEDIGIANQVTAKWKNGADVKETTLIKIANYLETSIDYIAGRTNEESSGITELINKEVSNMNEKQKAQLLADIYKNKE